MCIKSQHNGANNKQIYFRVPPFSVNSHTALILFDAYDCMVHYETYLSLVQQHFFEKKYKFHAFYFTEKMKILLFINIYYN